jgi:hypothetical protein
MPEDDRRDNHSLPPGPIQIDGEVFNQLLKHTIDAATKSAEGATKSAAALQAVETQLQELKGQCQLTGDAVKRLADVAETENNDRKERGKWLRSLIKPETLYYTVVIIASMFGATWAQKLLPLATGGSP